MEKPAPTAPKTNPPAEGSSSEARAPAGPSVAGRIFKWSVTSRVGLGLYAVLAVIGAFGVGYLTGWLQTRPSVVEAEQAAKSSEAALTRSGEKITDAKQAVRRLEGRRRLSLAVDAIEALNLGIAQRHLDAAARFLEKSAGGSAELLKLAEAVKGLQLKPGGLDAQKKQVLAFLSRFDEIVPPPTP